MTTAPCRIDSLSSRYVQIDYRRPNICIKYRKNVSGMMGVLMEVKQRRSTP